MCKTPLSLEFQHNYPILIFRAEFSIFRVYASCCSSNKKPPSLVLRVVTVAPCRFLTFLPDFGNRLSAQGTDDWHASPVSNPRGQGWALFGLTWKIVLLNEWAKKQYQNSTSV